MKRSGTSTQIVPPVIGSQSSSQGNCQNDLCPYPVPHHHLSGDLCSGSTLSVGGSTVVPRRNPRHLNPSSSSPLTRGVGPRLLAKPTVSVSTSVALDNPSIWRYGSSDRLCGPDHSAPPLGGTPVNNGDKLRINVSGLIRELQMMNHGHKSMIAFKENH